MNDYNTVLEELQSALENTECNYFIAVGKFNADPKKGRLWNYLEDLSSYNNFSFTDLSQANTFLSAGLIMFSRRKNVLID